MTNNTDLTPDNRHGLPDGIPMPERLWAILAITFGVSLSVLDGSIANVALPTISHLLDISAADSIWIVNAYQLAIVVSLLTLSSLGDIIGYRRIYLFGLSVFTVASAGCALSGTFGWLVVSRIFQGFGAAAITSVNTTLIRLIYPKRFLGRGLGLNATVVAISSVAGPSIAAAILSAASWHWLFAVNIPIGIIAFAFSRRFLPDNPANPAKTPKYTFDWRDGVLNALTFGLLIASIEGYSHGVPAHILITGIALLAFIGTYFVRSQLRKTYPILPFDLLRIPIFSMSVITSVCSFIAQMSAMVALPFYIQRTLGYSAVSTGLLLTAWPAIIAVTAPAAGIMVERIHAGLLGGIGLSIMSVGLLLLAWMPENPAPADIIWRLLMCGLGFGLFQSPNNSIMIASAPQHRSGSASGMLATARLLGQSTGAALVAMLFGTAAQNPAHTALITAAIFAGTGAVISLSRLSLPMPEELAHKSRHTKH